MTNSLGALLRSWPAYEAGLRRRGDLTVWVDEAALAIPPAPRRSTPGEQPRYSELAIQLVLILRLVSACCMDPKTERSCPNPVWGQAVRT